MKAIVVHDPVRDQHDVYLYVEGPNGRIGIRIVDGCYQFDGNLPAGGSLPVTLTLPTTGLQAIVDAATKVLPVDAGMLAALDDTRRIRDRLLTIVEDVIVNGRA